MNIFARRRPGDHRHSLSVRLINAPFWLRWGVPAVAVIFVAFLCWLGFQAWSAKSHLEQARGYAQQAKDALLGGKTDDAERWAENAQFNARQAQAATHSVPFTIAGKVPVLGSPLRTAQQISDVVVGLASDVLIPATKLGGSISPDQLVEGTRVNLNLLRQEQSPLSNLAAAAAELDNQSQAIAKPAYLAAVGDARSQLQDQTAKLSSLLTSSYIAAQLAPSMLGADGPRNYLMAFQTPSEARGTGGILGAFGIIRFENGAPAVDTLASNNYLRKNLDADANAVAEINLGQEFDKVYGWMNPYSDLRNSNVSPHFPYAARIWKSMWETSMWGRDSDQSIDGVMAFDIVALSYILGAIGPVTMPDGEVITQENLVELTGSTVYRRFPLATDVAPRKAYLENIAKAIMSKATTAPPSPGKLLDALGKAVNERRISVWSASPEDQRLLEQTPLAHVVPDDSAPYAHVVINNLAGNKMDYYLRREIEYAADGCDNETRNSTVTVRLTNTASDDSLPAYYAGTEGLNREIPITLPNGSMVTSVRVIGTKGARLLSVTSNGERTSAITHFENGHPSFEVQVAIPPGQSGELTFRLVEPTTPGEARVPVQPLIDTITPKIAVPACR